MAKFSSQSTVALSEAMKEYVVKILTVVFEPRGIYSMDEVAASCSAWNSMAGTLDQHFGIDWVMRLNDGAVLTIQSKVRDAENLRRWGDFTQEYKNAVGTQYERTGEYFHLGAHLYFYGWANESLDGFEDWLILNVPAYVLHLQSFGGIAGAGMAQQNDKHGRASFYGITRERLKPAIIAEKPK